MRFTAMFLLSCVLAGGCTRQTKNEPAPPDQSRPPEATGVMPPMPGAGPTGRPAGDQDILVKINGKNITRAHARLAIQRARAQNPRRQVTLTQAVQMLIANTLISDEIQKLKIEVSDEELAAERVVVGKNLPGETTLEEAMKKDGISEEALQRVLRHRVRTRKFLEAKGHSSKPTEKDYENYVAGYEAIVKGRAAKRELAEKIRKDLIAGADFAEMAQKHSGCPSKQKGGDLGEFPRGKMVPAFDKAAFSQKVNEIGPVVETEFGFHIIQVTEKKAAGEKSDTGLAVPTESVRARHILISAKKLPAPLPEKKMIMARLEAQRVNMAFASIVRDLLPNADIQYVGMQPPAPPQRHMPPRPTVAPPTRGASSGKPGVKIQTTPGKPAEKKTVTSDAVPAPKPPPATDKKNAAPQP